MTSVYYASTYGSTKQYAEELARRVEVEVVPIAEAEEVSEDPAAGPIVVLAPAHGPMHEGVKFVRSLANEVLQKPSGCHRDHGHDSRRHR